MGSKRLKVVITSAITVALAASLCAPALAAPQQPSPSKSATKTAPPEPTVPPGPPVHVSLKSNGSTPPQMEAVGWLLADATTGEILASRGADVPRPPASTLKVLTAVSLLPHLQPKSLYRATHQDEGTEGSHAGIIAGGQYRVIDLCHGLLLPSGNDAAMSIARAYGGVSRAVAKMNAEAKRLGAAHTHAVNPSGLDANGQVSTPKDLVTLFRAALGVELFRKTINLRSVGFPGGPKVKGKPAAPFQIWSQDRLLHHGYQGLIGGKSGYTTNAGRTFVGGATRNGHTLIYSLMGTEIATEDAARKILDWGFANIGKVNPVGHLPNPKPALGPAVPAPAAQYSIDGKLLTPKGQIAGAPVKQQAGAQRQVSKNNQQSSTVGLIAVDLPWLGPVIIGFLGVLVILVAICIGLATRGNKRSQT